MALRWLLFTTILTTIQSSYLEQKFVVDEQKFAMEPQNQTAIEGSKVTLPCRVINKSGTLQWTKDDFGLGPHRNLSGYDRYRMVGSDEEGMFVFLFLFFLNQGFNRPCKRRGISQLHSLSFLFTNSHLFESWIELPLLKKKTEFFITAAIANSFPVMFESKKIDTTFDYFFFTPGLKGLVWFLISLLAFFLRAGSETRNC